MLWFLHLASAAGVTVLGYEDKAVGTMRIEAAGQGQFREVVLRPRVTVAPGAHLPDGGAVTDAVLGGIHHQAHEHCFISRSVNFPVRHEPVPVRVAESPAERRPSRPPQAQPARLEHVAQRHVEAERSDVRRVTAGAEDRVPRRDVIEDPERLDRRRQPRRRASRASR